MITTFIIIIITLMIIDDINIKSDIKSASKIKFTKNDSEKYYNNYLKNK